MTDSAFNLNRAAPALIASLKPTLTVSNGKVTATYPDGTTADWTALLGPQGLPGVGSAGPQGTPGVGFTNPTITSAGVLTLDTAAAPATAGQTVTVGNVMGPANTINKLAYQRAPSSSSPIKMAAGMAVLTITGTGAVAAQTVALPSSPTDGQFVRISSLVPITLLTVTDASGVSLGTAFALPVLSAGGLFQFQSNSWVRIA